MRARILGTGMYVPPRVVSNEELAGVLECSPRWIEERTGILERRYAEDGQGAADLALPAARDALARAGTLPQEIDLILFATLSPDICFPGSACLLQRALGIAGCAAMDLRNQCSGFLYALSTADAFIRTGQYRRVLVVGAEVHSSGLDFSPGARDVTCLFGDGAGAAVLGPAEGEADGLLSAALHADGSHVESLCLIAPQSRRQPRITPAMLEAGLHFPRMEGRTVFRKAVEALPAVILEALERAELPLSSVAQVIPHQANGRIIDAVGRALEMAPERLYKNIHRYGNTTAASIPIALHEAAEEGRFQRGDVIVMAAFGAGFTWGALVARW